MPRLPSEQADHKESPPPPTMKGGETTQDRVPAHQHPPTRTPPHLEDPRNPPHFIDPQNINIPPGVKETAAKSHREWLHNPANSTLLYSDCSRNATNSAGWQITSINDHVQTTLHEGSCNLGPQADILDEEIYAIPEGIR